ncbi:hypothetical protein [Mycolicibacterium sp. 120270]|uniref:hypothetical protein n=1 Tax=Mycolicibacterium sp. 120270 TaxID=3090600 RepID=UPI00299CEFDE|nr:hypothetical protein [Mycolicibacterium sp. 120270]MDX1885985.1 hypothetical protein [Mycolicibacterium sp. 120270]
MQLFIQLKGRDEDVAFRDGATYQVHGSGVLRVNSGSDIHLYSPSYWQEVIVDTRAGNASDEDTGEADDDLCWQ